MFHYCRMNKVERKIEKQLIFKGKKLNPTTFFNYNIFALLGAGLSASGGGANNSNTTNVLSSKAAA